MRPTEHAEQELLDERSAAGYLGSRGLVAPATAHARALGGGVSNVVLAVTDARRSVVVKQSLARLRVADEWTAPVERVLTEADALDIAGALTPGRVPAVLDRDPARHAIVLEHAPPGWSDWKTQLLAGVVRAGVARELGEVLATWHARTVDGRGLPGAFRDRGPFEQLRVDPYYRTTARRAPEVADAVLELVAEMGRRRPCLVHGDLSPKNVLVPVDEDDAEDEDGARGGSLWVIDLEVAHCGDPAFDVAFLLTHLTLKSLHAPPRAAQLDACATAFADAYAAGVGADLQPDWGYVLRHVACLLLARVRGKSPAEYLTAGERDAAWRLGLGLLARPAQGLAELHRRRDEELA